MSRIVSLVANYWYIPIGGLAAIMTLKGDMWGIPLLVLTVGGKVHEVYQMHRLRHLRRANPHTGSST